MRKIQVELKYFIVLTVFLLACFPFASFADASFEQCKANVLPSYINNSMYWSPSYEKNTGGAPQYQAFRSLSPFSILVVGAGNGYDTPLLPYTAKASRDFNAIIVGSLTPDGRRSRFSQQGEEVHIMAPADYPQTSVNRAGDLKSFGGTSGATPLVTGSLAGFEWLSGYHPTSKEAKILLEKTAIPTRYSKDNPRTNGVGMVNAYKLGMVGKRLKKICGQNKSCIKGKIYYDPSIYSFPEDSSLPEALDQAFPECRSDACIDSGSSEGLCKDTEALFKRLRKAVLLNPSNGELWRYLACIYKSSGLDENAEGAIEFYTNSVFPDGVAHCKTDADCTLVPDDCEYDNRDFDDLKAITKAEAAVYYIEEPACRKPLCNGKCRCSNQETVEEVPPGPIRFGRGGKRYRQSGYSVVFSSRCVEFRCRLKVTKEPLKESETPIVEESPAEENSSSSSGSE